MKEGYHTPQNLQADKTSELQACVTLQGKGRMTLSAEQSSAQSQGAERQDASRQKGSGSSPG